MDTSSQPGDTPTLDSLEAMLAMSSEFDLEAWDLFLEDRPGTERHVYTGPYVTIKASIGEDDRLAGLEVYSVPLRSGSSQERIRQIAAANGLVFYSGRLQPSPQRDATVDDVGAVSRARRLAESPNGHVARSDSTASAYLP